MSRVARYCARMKTKDEIVRDWLPRYTGRKLEVFGLYILLVNFSNYVELFAERFDKGPAEISFKTWVVVCQNTDVHLTQSTTKGPPKPTPARYGGTTRRVTDILSPPPNVPQQTTSPPPP